MTYFGELARGPCETILSTANSSNNIYVIHGVRSEPHVKIFHTEFFLQ